MTQTAEEQKAQALNSLENWISNTANKIKESTQQVSEATNEEGGKYASCKSFALNLDVDFDSFTRKDLSALQPAFEKLHDICEKMNIAVDMAGFDLLPRTHLAGQATVVQPTGLRRSNFLISVDTKREYNYAINPFSSKDVPTSRAPSIK